MAMMSTASSPAHDTQPFPAADVYDADEDVLVKSPTVQAMTLKLSKAPSPEPLGLGRVYRFNKKGKHGMRSGMGDRALLRGMGGTGEEKTPSPITEDIIHGDASDTDFSEDDDDDEKSGTYGREVMDEGEVRIKDEQEEKPKVAHSSAIPDDLRALAAKVMDRIPENQGMEQPVRVKGLSEGQSKNHDVGGEMEDVKPSLPSFVDGISACPILTVTTTTETSIKSPDFLPPIQLSPVSSSGTSVTLPSISEKLGDIKLPDTPREAVFPLPQSPPHPLPPLFNQTSPTSPRDYRALPSPGPGFFHNQPTRRHSHADQHTYMGSIDYNSSSTAETPSDKSTPGSSLGLHRMSIDGLDNPQIGGYQCTFSGCSAAPFQTQYLLSSHANVHSSNRPHYCPVKGCARSEGGKGFKRKNEMIRHGLVHDSPGYVCPFCPDREHKYPRPDNLQRHVRVHHVDKDKDDPALRDVLAQRPEGPSRGRRRRGTTGAV